MSDNIAHVIFVIVCSLIYGFVMTFVTCRGKSFKEKVKGFLSFSITLGFTYLFVYLVRNFY